MSELRPDGSWFCPDCDSLNPRGRTRCWMCLAPGGRPIGRAGSATIKPAPRVLVGKASVAATSRDSWWAGVLLLGAGATLFYGALSLQGPALILGTVGFPLMMGLNAGDEASFGERFLLWSIGATIAAIIWLVLAVGAVHYFLTHLCGPTGAR